MVCGYTSDFIDQPLHKHFVSAHGASHHAWAPGPPPSKSGAGQFLPKIFSLIAKYNKLQSFSFPQK